MSPLYELTETARSLTDLLGVEVEKLTNPKDQVGMPNTHKWAVMTAKGGFETSFQTKREAEHYAETLRADLRAKAPKAVAVWDRSVLGYSKADLDEMDADERARTLVELLNQAADLAEAITSAFGADLKATGGFHHTKSAAAELKMAAKQAAPKP
jgi:hypothetical protein